MKLIQKTNRNFLAILLFIVPISSIILFYSLNYFIHNEVDEKLKVDESRIIEQIESGSAVNSLKPIFEVKKMAKLYEESSRISNTKVYDPIEKEMEPFRELVSIKNINHKSYAIIVRQATIETQDLLFVILLIVFGIFIFLFGLIFLLNARISRKMWQPFQNNLNQLKHFSIDKTEKLDLQSSTIDEFSELNTSLEQMTNRIKDDYRILKEFTENASHEIQTPLSIISLKLDEIMQEDLPENTLTKIYSVYQSTQRLSKLNEKLLLLAKLDNQQFSTSHTISLNDVLKQQLEEFQPIFENAQISVSTNFYDNFWVNMDDYLATILVTNILSNAAKYNLINGEITIKVNPQNVVITNTTKESIDVESIFYRFRKGTSTIESTGLGLAIVQKIADLGQLQISASLNSGVFQIKISK